MSNEGSRKLVVTCDHLDLMARLYQFFNHFQTVFFKWTLRDDESAEGQITLSFISCNL